jgi:hypothetical protein
MNHHHHKNQRSGIYLVRVSLSYKVSTRKPAYWDGMHSQFKLRHYPFYQPCILKAGNDIVAGKPQ